MSDMEDNTQKNFLYYFQKITGFSDKTLWDWLQLLIVPVILSAGFWYFNTQYNNQVMERDLRIAEDLNRETVFQSYLDNITELILVNNLLDLKESNDSSVKKVAQVRTIHSLRLLDPPRKNLLIQYLRDSGLNAYLLSNTNLTGINLDTCDLSEINFAKSILNDNNFSSTSLYNNVSTG